MKRLWLILFVISSVWGQEIDYYKMGLNDADSVMAIHKESNWTIGIEGITDEDFYGPQYTDLNIEQKKMYEKGFSRREKAIIFSYTIKYTIKGWMKSSLRWKVITCGICIIPIGVGGYLISLLI